MKVRTMTGTSDKLIAPGRSLHTVAVATPSSHLVCKAEAEGPVKLHSPSGFNPDGPPPPAGYYEGEFTLSMTAWNN